MGTLTKVFSDIDFTFTQRPVVGDIAVSYDQQAVIRSIRNLLLTRHYERPFNPDLGGNIEGLLFENASQTVSATLENEITNVINNYEPRVTLQTVSVSVQPDLNSYSVRITFYLKNAATPTTINVILERNR